MCKFIPILSDSFLLQGSLFLNMKQKTPRIDLTKWVIHFHLIQIVFHFIFRNLQPLVTERIAQLMRLTLEPVGIKSSETFFMDFMKDLERFQAVHDLASH